MSIKSIRIQLNEYEVAKLISSLGKDITNNFDKRLLTKLNKAAIAIGTTSIADYAHRKIEIPDVAIEEANKIFMDEVNAKMIAGIEISEEDLDKYYSMQNLQFE